MHTHTHAHAHARTHARTHTHTHALRRAEIRSKTEKEKKYFFYSNSDRTALFIKFKSCVKVEVAVLGFPSLISLMVSVDVKQH